MATGKKSKKKETQKVIPKTTKKETKKSFSFFTYGIAATIVVITWISFLPSLKNDFTDWDDPVYVQDNPLVKSDHISLEDIFKTPVSLNYHPLTILSLAVNYQSSKLDAQAYHRTNLILHVLNTLLVFFFILMLSNQNLFIATFTSILFGIHPMHVESVAWISERKDVLYVFFFLAGLITYLKYREQKKTLWYAITFLLFILSCLSKAMAVIFPVVLLLIDSYQGRKWLWQWVIEKIPFFIVSLIIGITAFNIQSKQAVGDFTVLTLLQRITIACYGATMYIVKFFAPFRLSAFYPYPTVNNYLVLPVYYYFTIVFIALLFYIVWRLRRDRALVFGLGFYFVAIVFVLQFISVGNAIIADRYTYLAYVGLAFTIAYYTYYLIFEQKFLVVSERVAIIGSLLILTLIFAPQTYARCSVWQNPETLWTDVINKYPNQEIAYKNRGTYYWHHQELDKGYADYMVLVKKHSVDSKAYSNVGNVYAMRSRPDSAMWAYAYALSLDSTNTDAYVNRAITWMMLKKFDNAIDDLHHALQLQPQLYIAYQALGSAYLQSGQYEKSIQSLSIYIQHQPDDGKAYYFRGEAYHQSGNDAAAKRDMQRAQQLGFSINDLSK